MTAAQAYSPLRDINLIKRRILEIYFNAIEFGPYLYGIGKAARHYFGKSAKDLTPREAAWFSSILPNPKRRYIHFCKERLTRNGRSTSTASCVETMSAAG